MNMKCIINTLLGGTVVTWSKDNQVLSADNVKVLMDSRLQVHFTPLGGVNISIRQDYRSATFLPLTESLFSNLRGSDSGYYRCTLNFNKKALHVEHKLLVQGQSSNFQIFKTFRNLDISRQRKQKVFSNFSSLISSFNERKRKRYYFYELV